MPGLAILFGGCVGFALGLTGGGGGLFAVPLLVYGLDVAAREAVGISLASVGGTALFGVLPRLRQGIIELRTGVLFAIFGMLGAPVGNKLSGIMSEQTLLLLFSGLMLLIATRMWQQANPPSAMSSQEFPPEERRTPICQRSDDGRLLLTTKCGMLLGSLGFGTGILSGLFGVGGGFVIVPALVLLSGMPIHKAVGTSLMVIVLVSISGVGAYVRDGGHLSLDITGLFILGGFFGMGLGTRLSKRLPGPLLQRVFSAAIVLVAILVIMKSTFTQT